MVLNTQSYMWDGIGLDGIGYLLGPTLRAPYGANNMITLTGGELRQWNDQHIYSCCNYHHHSCYRDPDNNQKCIFNNSIYMSSPCQWWPCILCRIGWPRCPSGSPLDPSLGTRSGASTARPGCSSTGKPMGMMVNDYHSDYVGHSVVMMLIRILIKYIIF